MKKDYERLLQELLALADHGPTEKQQVDWSKRGHTAEEVEGLIDMIRDMRDEYAESAWSTASRNLFRRILQDAERARRETSHPYGILTFDSRLVPLSEGVRPAPVAEGRLRYVVDDFQLELSVQPITAASVQLIGQLVGRPGTGSLTAVYRQGRTSVEVPLNQFQMFRFARVPAGSGYLLVQEGNNVVAEIHVTL